jgi:hypothetical protein
MYLFTLSMLPVPQDVHRQMTEWLMDDKSENMCKEDAVPCFEVLSQFSPSEAKENHSSRTVDSRCPEPDTSRIKSRNDTT